MGRSVVGTKPMMSSDGGRERELPQALLRFKASEQRTINALLDLRQAWMQWVADPTEGHRQEALAAGHEASRETTTYLALAEEVMAAADIETPQWMSNLGNSLGAMGRELLDTLSYLE
jgi:hypothetical protein